VDGAMGGTIGGAMGDAMAGAMDDAMGGATAAQWRARGRCTGRRNRRHNEWHIGRHNERHIGWRGGRSPGPTCGCVTTGGGCNTYSWRGQNVRLSLGFVDAQKSAIGSRNSNLDITFLQSEHPRADHPANNIASFMVREDDGLPAREMTRQPENAPLSNTMTVLASSG